MAPPRVTHDYVSANGDPPDPTLIGQTKWNADHRIEGLGSAAELDAGTSAGNVIALDNDGKLPAVDGSQLTNIPTSGLAAVIDDPAPKLGADLDLNGHGIPGIDYASLANKPTLGTAAAHAEGDFATAAQGSKADTAVQPGSLAAVATTGAYSDLTGKPTLGTSASHDVGDFATAAQGALADSAVQAGTLAPVATTGSYSDLTGKPTLGTAASHPTSDFATAAQGAKADTAVQPIDIVAVITPEQFGCAGDGVTDDTGNFATALAAAISAGVDLVLGKNKTYLLNTWSSSGYSTTSKTRIRGADRTSVLKGPSGGAYFLRPGNEFSISGIKFDRWTGVIRRDAADGGTISGARFTDNECVNITGIPINIEISFQDSYITRNRFASCSGGYVIRIGYNDYASQDNWCGNYICENVLRSITASSTTSLFAILVYGRDTLIDGNDLDGLTSTGGEAIGIYTKLRFSQITNNRVRNVTSTGTSGAALDVVGISLKGAIRTVTNSGCQGFKCICVNNQVRSVGAQGAKGTGIRCQISDSIVAANVIQDVGILGINVDDSNGSSFNKILNNSIEGLSVLGTYGIYLSTFGAGHRIIGNSIRAFTQSIHIEGSGGNLTNTLVDGNSIATTRTSSFGIAFYGSNTVKGVLITGNDVNVPSGGYVVLNNDTVSGVNIRNNDFSTSVANGAGNLLGSATGITSASNP